jgi:hypothetical protein
MNHLLTKVARHQLDGKGSERVPPFGTNLVLILFIQQVGWRGAASAPARLRTLFWYFISVSSLCETETDSTSAARGTPTWIIAPGTRGPSIGIPQTFGKRGRARCREIIFSDKFGEKSCSGEGQVKFFL